jgi:hypothetical protein
MIQPWTMVAVCCHNGGFLLGHGLQEIMEGILSDESNDFSWQWYLVVCNGIYWDER